jgi:hypothetical protein
MLSIECGVVFAGRLLFGWCQLSQDLQEWVEQMDEVDSFQEAFDIMEVLPDVLSEGTDSADQFVIEAVRLQPARWRH